MNKIFPKFFLEADEKILLFLNQLGSESWDSLWIAISSVGIWIPMYALLLWGLWKVHRKNFFLIVGLLVIGVFLADSGSVYFFKQTFKRLRPCHVAYLAEQLRIVDGCGGAYGFISSHASNTFMLALFVGSLLSKWKTWVLPVMVFWAMVVSYSRIYLGVHYPADIIFGAVYGGSIGLFLFIIFKIHHKK